MAQLIPNGKKITESKKALFPKKALEDMHKREVAAGSINKHNLKEYHKEVKSKALQSKKEQKPNAAREAGQSGNWGKFFGDLTK